MYGPFPVDEGIGSYTLSILSRSAAYKFLVNSDTFNKMLDKTPVKVVFLVTEVRYERKNSSQV